MDRPYEWAKRRRHAAGAAGRQLEEFEQEYDAEFPDEDYDGLITGGLLIDEGLAVVGGQTKTITWHEFAGGGCRDQCTL